MSRLQKAIDLARSKKTDNVDLRKGVHDAMAYHALAYKAADSARYALPDGNQKEGRRKAIEDAAKKHEFLFLRHALENARNKCNYPGNMRYRVQRALEFYSDDAPWNDADPEYSRIKAHYVNGGAFLGHKDDKFKEDY